MRNPVIAISLFIGCLLVVFVAMGWLTWTILRLDRAEEQSQRSAQFEENVRLALWRMDSALAPILAQENARPYFMYRSHYPAERAYDRMFGAAGNGETLTPSPLLNATTPHVLLHFQIDPDGSFTSPQIPNAQSAAGEFSQRLQQLEREETRLALLGSVPLENAMTVSNTVPPELINAPQQSEEEYAQSLGKQRQTAGFQQKMSANEYNWRYMHSQGQSVANKNPYSPQTSERAQVKEGMFVPKWVGSSLFLLRKIEVDDLQYIQGCWLDWNGLASWLRTQVSDLLPHAALQPVNINSSDSSQDAGRLLAALPVRLIPGTLPPPERAVMLSPLKLSLIAVWVCVLIAAAAVAVLLRGALLLSERRGAFVSAVTHELRTPLTTFRMYTQMLSDQMVSDPEKQKKYLDVLRVEADRLSHLVENVLAYARLEKGRAGGRAQELSAVDLLQRVTERPRERAAQAGVALVVDTSGDQPQRSVRADPAAVEQIVFNLVDNACKYARAEKPRVTIALDFSTPSSVAIAVTDNGPGISAPEGRKLFRPFSKSAKEAAHSAPGVGLGLALSRRLAREMGGDLTLDAGFSGGARFVLTLRAV
ncbi:MAG TPA: HAMP domain-containing sensor histidine kinase [Planctomycetota bacterium]|nr:HAMP domain-containing sensor histidine kinase [Planctomycetota bacterium]